MSSDTTIATGRLPVRPASRPTKRPALKLAGAVKPMMVLSGLTNAAGHARPTSETTGVPSDAPPVSEVANEIESRPAVSSTLSPVRRASSLPTAESLAAWVREDDEYSLRFACSDGVNFGNIAESELAYFRSDSQSLMERAALIGDVLGFSPPSLAAIVELERAAGYRCLADGFAGLYCGPGCTRGFPDRYSLTPASMTSELEAISNTPGITGLCLHRETEVLHHNLPDTYGNAAATDLSHVVAGIFSAYSDVDRPVTQGYFQYPECGILVLKSGPGKNSAAKACFLIFLISDQAAISAVLAPARVFLARQARA